MAWPRSKPAPPPTGGSAPATGPITAARVRELHAKGAKAIAAENRAYQVNRAFVAGEQHIYWDDNRSRPDTLPTVDGVERRTFNHLWPSSRILMAKLLRRPLVFAVAPTAADDASVAGARKATAAVAGVHAEHNWERMRNEHTWAVWKGGTAALALEWDPTAGANLGPSPDTGRPVGSGYTREFALSIAEMVTEPGTRDVERAGWWIRLAALPPSEVQALYGLADLPAADASARLSPLQRRLSDNEGELSLVLTYYERPAGGRPGQVAVVVGDAVVSAGPWPFPFHDVLNVCVARETPDETRWTGDTVLSAAISPQRTLNRAEASVDEHMDAAGNARLVVEDGSVDDEEWDNDPASIVKVRPGAQRDPAYLSPAQMPAWWQARPDQLRAVIDDILGVHDVSRGEASGAGSGVALTLLAENDDTPLGAFAKELGDCWGRFATLWLRTCAELVTDTRTARITGAGQDIPEVVGWTGKDFHGQTTATVPAEAVAPRGRAASFQLASQLKAAYPDLPVAVFASIADLPGQDDLTEGLDPDIARARRENHHMALGIVATPEKWDNHATHIAELRRFCKSGRWEQLDDETKELFELHAQAHDVLAAEEMGEQVARGTVSPALAAAAQSGEPPMAGEAVPPPPVDPNDPTAAPTSGNEAVADPAGPPVAPPGL